MERRTNSASPESPRLDASTADGGGTTADGGGLHVEDLTVRFGGIVALDDARLNARTGEITGLIGPNGAGKTTLFNCLTGIYAANSGRVSWQGDDLLGKPPYRIADHGIARTFQNLALFPNLTVRENVIVGLHRVRKSNWISNSFRLPSVISEAHDVRDTADAALAEVELAHVASKPAAGLPYGTLKRVELARAIAAEPGLLLLDEPAAGLAHGEVDELMELIRRLRDRRKLTIVLVEHHMGLVMRLCDRVTVLNFGRTIAEGEPEEIGNNQAVIDAYLGGGE